MELAFYHNGIKYYFSPYIEEIYYPLGGTNYQYILMYELDNDTLIVGKEVTAQFTTSTMRIDNYLKPNYRVTLNHAEYYDHLETLHGRLAIVEEPYNMPMYAIITDDDERYLIEPYFVNYAEYDELVFGEDTVAVGNSFTATGEVFKYYDDYYEDFYFNGINILEINEIDAPFLIGNEWYYEIQNENGSITYQYLYQAGDTIVQDEPTHILVKINTLYDKDFHEEITHEYVFERNGKVYWWNKTLEEFTVLYDFGAQEGDTWVTKVGTETLVMHVDAVETIEYEDKTYRMLHVGVHHYHGIAFGIVKTSHHRYLLAVVAAQVQIVVMQVFAVQSHHLLQRMVATAIVYQQKLPVVVRVLFQPLAHPFFQ